MFLKAWPKPFQYFRDVRVFLVSLSAIIALLMTVVFYFRYDSIRKLMVQSMMDQARSYADQIVLTRHWNARYGGVYVEKKQGVKENAYLRQVGVDPDIRTVDGRSFTLRNPAAMTRELSELTMNENGVRFHMISLRALNPENKPDPFERQALERFERGSGEAWQLESVMGLPVFRYIVPLMVDEPCLACHGHQGYKVGDVRGGISVLIPTASMDRQMRKNRVELLVVWLGTIALIIGVLYFMTWNMVVRLDDAQKKLKRIAVTDELTGLRNRRYIMEHLETEYQRSVRSGAPLSLILLDIDHFKRVNDSYGHAFGDQVLKAVADVLRSGLRPYDLLGRIGGEEFLIASPGSSLDEASGLAQRILDKVRSTAIGNKDREVSVTASAGVTCMSSQDARADVILGRADMALYMAKQEGRDRVVTL